MELNREQIIKALECCIKTQCENCCNLGSWHEQWNCMTDLMKKAISIINELTEENKAWQMQLISQEEKASKAYYDLACEVEDLKAIAEGYQKQFEDCAEDKAKLTEENERLKEAIKYYSELEQGCFVTGVKNVIADTVRKMQERLKAEMENIARMESCGEYYFLISKKFIDSVAKKMLEDST